MSDLRNLARPFPDKYIKSNPTGFGSYVAHHIVNQRLLQAIGPFDFALVEVIRGEVAEWEQKKDGKVVKVHPELNLAVVGVVARMTVQIDGQTVTVEEAGDCENPHNWPHDGARMKDAMSDAFKRCAMRFGLGLHLWSQGNYYLYERLAEAEAEAESTGEVVA